MLEGTAQPTVEASVTALVNETLEHRGILKVHLISNTGMHVIHVILESLLEDMRSPTLVVPITILKDLILNLLLHTHDSLIKP